MIVILWGVCVCKGLGDLGRENRHEFYFLSENGRGLDTPSPAVHPILWSRPFELSPPDVESRSVRKWGRVRSLAGRGPCAEGKLMEPWGNGTEGQEGSPPAWRYRQETVSLVPRFSAAPG